VLQRTAGDDEDGENVLIEASASGPRETARSNRKGPPHGRRDGKPKPHRKNGNSSFKPGPKGKGSPNKAKGKKN